MSKPTDLPPAQPTYILRGHASQIHALSFTAQNRRLLSGDGDGVVISWDIATKRPVAGWRAHDKAILSVCAWPSATLRRTSHSRPPESNSSSATAPPLSESTYDGDDIGGNGPTSTRVITQGRDGTIRLWRLDAADEKPTDGYVAPEQLLSELGKKPTMLLELAVGAVSFCGFAVCAAPADMVFGGTPSTSNASVSKTTGTTGNGENSYASAHEIPNLLLAAPHAGTSEDIDLFYLPSGARKSSITSPRDGTPRLGMLMSVLVSAGGVDEGGDDGSSMPLTVAAGYENGAVLVYRHDVAADAWTVVYRARPHAQPVLSLCLHPARTACFSSAADDVVAKHPFGGTGGGADERARSATKTEEEEGDVEEVPRTDEDTDARVLNITPLKVVRTKHAGQQGLAARNDGRIIAAAGWDARIRVYSAKTLRELAVLKAHRQGCYMTAFAEVGGEDRNEEKHGDKHDEGGEAGHEATQDESAEVSADVKDRRESVGAEDARKAPVSRLRQSPAMARYEQKIWTTHWLAAGSKDGTISLWDVF